MKVFHNPIIVRRSKKMRKFMKNRKGFTLVELLIVVVILGILAAVAIPRFMTTRDETQFRTCQSQLAAINGAVDEWMFMNPGVAVDIAVILGNTDRFPDGVPTCPTDDGAYSLDANNRAVCAIHGTIAVPIPPA